MVVEITKQYTTRDGGHVRIYATDGVGLYPVHGAILKDGKWYLSKWTLYGIVELNQPTKYDLIEIKPKGKLKGWFNFYKGGISNLQSTREAADSISGEKPMGVVKLDIEYVEGELIELNLTNKPNQ